MNTIDLNTKKAFIKKQKCFSQFTDQEVTELAGLLVEKHMKVGDVVVIEGDPVDSIYLIVEGTVDIRIAKIVNNAIEAQSVAKLTVGDAIGLNDTGFYSLSGKRTATVVALTDLVLLYLNIAAFHGFSLANHHVNQLMRKNAEEMLSSTKS